MSPITDCNTVQAQTCIDTCERKEYDIHKRWPERELLITGQKIVVNTPIINPEKVNFPPLHIKLGLIKNFVEAVDQNIAEFMYTKNKFLRKSEAKIKEGIFAGPQMRGLTEDVKFEHQLSEVEKAAWK